LQQKVYLACLKAAFDHSFVAGRILKIISDKRTKAIARIAIATICHSTIKSLYKNFCYKLLAKKHY
jgi:hypothetical protein